MTDDSIQQPNSAILDWAMEEFDAFWRPFELICTGCRFRSRVEGAIPAALVSQAHRDRHLELAPFEPLVRIVELDYREWASP